MTAYRCIVCEKEIHKKEFGYHCLNFQCPMFARSMNIDMVKALDEKRKTFDGFLADHDALTCERDCATDGMNYWKDQAFVARIEREEARQIAQKGVVPLAAFYYGDQSDEYRDILDRIERLE